MEQKDKKMNIYQLANGEFIPCFGPGPNNGSDATGSIDEGTVLMKDHRIDKFRYQQKIYYIGSVADLIGLAFNLKDPMNY